MMILLIKIICTLLVFIPNLILAYKIVTRPHIRSIFNSSLVCFFSISGIFGPFLYSSTIDITNRILNYDSDYDLEEWIATCSRYLGVKHLLAESLKIITSNIMFRFFYIVYAHRGLVSKGMMNTKLFKICFVVLTLALTFSGFFSYRLSKAHDKEYPQNTIVGRICLNLRLDWDKTDSKKSQDIYIKIQLLVAALTISWGSLYAYMIRRVRIFLPRMCINNTNHACFGGKYRRNILTFNELSLYFFFIISQFVIGFFLIFILYGIQDTITQDGVFMTYFGYTTLFFTFHLIIIPTTILFRSRTNYPIIWTNYKPKDRTFWSNLDQVVQQYQESKKQKNEHQSYTKYIKVAEFTKVKEEIIKEDTNH